MKPGDLVSFLEIIPMWLEIDPWASEMSTNALFRMSPPYIGVVIDSRVHVHRGLMHMLLLSSGQRGWIHSAYLEKIDR
jgi:hypothetical protein